MDGPLVGNSRTHITVLTESHDRGKSHRVTEDTDVKQSPTYLKVHLLSTKNDTD